MHSCVSTYMYPEPGSEHCMNDWTTQASVYLYVSQVPKSTYTRPVEADALTRAFEANRKKAEVSNELAAWVSSDICYGNFGPFKILVQDTKFLGKNCPPPPTPPDHFSLKSSEAWQRGSTCYFLITGGVSGGGEITVLMCKCREVTEN